MTSIITPTTTTPPTTTTTTTAPAPAPATTTTTAPAPATTTTTTTLLLMIISSSSSRSLVIVIVANKTVSIFFTATMISHRAVTDQRTLRIVERVRKNCWVDERPIQKSMTVSNSK